MIPDSVFNSQVTPYIDALPSPIHGQSVAITAGTSSVSATITDDSVKVGELLLSPSSPAAGQSYVASTDLQCIPFDSNVSIQVVGTDGYTDSNSKTYPQTIAADTISLQVPGGASGVRDTVTLQVNPRNSAPTTRTAYLVFQ
jgi:hypothetical protein